jgi:aminotransferase EvaB
MIKTFEYLRLFETLEQEIMEAVKKVLYSGHLILGPETKAFESEFADFVGAKHCIGVNSGTSALHLSLMGMGVGFGDEVITVANTCVPTISAIELSGATPVFIDVRDEDLMIDPEQITEVITERTKCILPVHLWGQSANMEHVLQIADQQGVFVVEDCAQAMGTMYRDQHVGTFGNTGCFSFYPTKNLAAYGDAGAIVTNDDELARRLRRMRMYGYDTTSSSVEKGMNARISEIQAAILRIKLRILPRLLNRRKEIALRYDDKIENDQIMLPYRHLEREHSFHQYVIRCKNREKVIGSLKNKEVRFGIHYPIPVHKMPAFKNNNTFSNSLPITEKASDEILSLPIHETLYDEEVQTVINCLCEGDQYDK